MKNTIYIAFLILIGFTSCAQNNDPIIGIWDVKNVYYQATYEIVEHEGKFFGKVHYYNDGKSEYKGDNKKEDYFLTDVEKQNGKYIKGKMYMPDGSFYNVVFTLKNDNTLEAKMTVDGQPYTENWKRNTSFN